MLLWPSRLYFDLDVNQRHDGIVDLEVIRLYVIISLGLKEKPFSPNAIITAMSRNQKTHIDLGY